MIIFLNYQQHHQLDAHKAGSKMYVANI